MVWEGPDSFPGAGPLWDRGRKASALSTGVAVVRFRDKDIPTRRRAAALLLSVLGQGTSSPPDRSGHHPRLPTGPGAWPGARGAKALFLQRLGHLSAMEDTSHFVRLGAESRLPPIPRSKSTWVAEGKEERRADSKGGRKKWIFSKRALWSTGFGSDGVLTQLSTILGCISQAFKDSSLTEAMQCQSHGITGLCLFLLFKGHQNHHSLTYRHRKKRWGLSHSSVIVWPARQWHKIGRGLQNKVWPKPHLTPSFYLAERTW